MKRTQLLAVIILNFFVIPSIAMASWWNPFSWSWFNKSTKTEIVQVIPPTATTTKNKGEVKAISDLTVSKDDIPKDTRTQTIKKTENGGEQYDRPIPIASVKFDNAVIKSVLRLKIYDTVTKQDISWGSGISIGGLGHILTNYHVVEKVIVNPARYQVYGCVTTSLNTQCDYFNYLLSTGASGSKHNKNLDLALVYIDQVFFDNKWSSVLDISLNALGDRTVNLSSYTKNIQDIYVNYPVYSIGYPDYGGGKTVQAEGVVKEIFTDRESGQKLILNSADISFGNSGGPVFNSNGELVGVTVQCLVASPNAKKCNQNSGLFIPLPTVNWWYSKMTNSEIAIWEGRQSYLPQNSGSWQGALCLLRQNSYYDATLSKDSCVCKAGYSKNSGGDCVDTSGYVDPTLRYGQAPDPEGEKKALQMLESLFSELEKGSINTPSATDQIRRSTPPSSEEDTESIQFCQTINAIWTGTPPCECKTGYAWNERGNSCVPVSSAETIKINNKICENNFGPNAVWYGTMSSAGGLNCTCVIGGFGHYFNKSNTACVTQDELLREGNPVWTKILSLPPQ
ncbi:MAG: hypothetical protein COV91_05495 [Candidatus Taylorbacteria bacterium CG11_big_fil_rev_8_21_14_0_20_46_11]|uniref:Peptidase S1 domain-containing protein n=1 Tax=Candidatus Taylorbacteria bacterium CG11_big_fil_rev_8_21_14_0_20_46_11 TaxID=1975025 RepID=A0A2H0KA95_9BACT|nr:MAG: hypothetical protein COV91_05495 [Candidatus Taylorbacteria bacterium CG11_big_fil_rev_8_21_14_0_20_46_11]